MANETLNEIEFNEKLAVGQIVEARWTNNFSFYACEAEVVKVNVKSLRVKLLKNHGPYLAGRVIVLPTYFDLRKWSVNNGAFPARAAAAKVG